MELLDAACCTSDAPAHQHVELQAAASAEPGEPGDIECLEERDHGHGSVHPNLECVCTGRFFRIYTSFMLLPFAYKIDFQYYFNNSSSIS